uniref:Caffeoyl-CoA O-methyltransferase n=1 Tax=Auxenochlorella protothecoides TaxID=3075 RepID=A0A1D1ZPN9_AUXPR
MFSLHVTLGLPLCSRGLGSPTTRALATRSVQCAKTKVSAGLDDGLVGYLLQHTRETEVLKDLRRETAELFPAAARMQITPDQGAFMHWLVATLRATRAIEVGVFTGYSSIATATALGPGGKLLACDPDERALAVARRCWDRAGVLDRVSQCGRGGVYASRMCGSRLLCGPDPLQGAGGLVPGSVRPFFSGACCCDCMLQEISGRCPADTPMAARMLAQSMQATLFGCLEEDMGPSIPGRLCRQCEASGLAVWWMSKILTLLHSGPCSPVRQHKPLLYWPQDRRACSSSSRDAGVVAERRRGRAIRLCVRGCRQARVHGVLRTAPAAGPAWGCDRL